MVKAKPRILAVDDEKDMLETFKTVLSKKYDLTDAPSAEKAEEILKTRTFSLALLDIRMPKKDGIELLKTIKEQDPNLEVIMVTASKDIVSAVESMKLGAFDYVTKPFDIKELQALIEKALEKRALVLENLYLRESLNEANSYFDLIGKTPQMKKLYETISRVGPTNSTVLVQGESGTGKELVARAIHQSSKRAARPFVTVNCAAIPETLFESELFGHERGSFTGALERKLGKFELADGGTLFLDEIGCMPTAMQAKLLRVLEDRLIERVGGEKGIPVDVRLISATNIDFEKHIKDGKFRHDLYYRLNVIPVQLIPLRERKEDIPLFVEYFLDKFNKILNKKIKGFSINALPSLLNYHWPGNVRELQNLIERCVVLAQGDVIAKDELFLQPASNPKKTAGTLKEIIENYEKETIRRILAENQGNITQAAKAVNTIRTSFISRMKSLGMNLDSVNKDDQ